MNRLFTILFFLLISSGLSFCADEVEVWVKAEKIPDSDMIISTVYHKNLRTGDIRKYVDIKFKNKVIFSYSIDGKVLVKYDFDRKSNVLHLYDEISGKKNNRGMIYLKYIKIIEQPIDNIQPARP